MNNTVLDRPNLEKDKAIQRLQRQTLSTQKKCAHYHEKSTYCLSYKEITSFLAQSAKHHLSHQCLLPKLKLNSGCGLNLACSSIRETASDGVSISSSFSFSCKRIGRVSALTWKSSYTQLSKPTIVGVRSVYLHVWLSRNRKCWFSGSWVEGSGKPVNCSTFAYSTFAY